jgi:peptide/nickel transport system ATP-binding protein
MIMLLEVQALCVRYLTARGEVHAVEDVSFRIARGESFGIVGESGCGKTTVALAIMRLLPPNASITSGAVIFNGEDLLKKSEEEMRSIRWKRISMIFQAAMNALNPVHRVGDQIVEAIVAHEPGVNHREAQKRVEELFGLVGLDPARARDYPHQFSGGMKQRAIIAMALACRPELVIADEPTTALDVMVQDQILGELRALQNELGLSILYISHDISIIGHTCDRIGVMYAGQLVESGPTTEVIENPRHPYTQGLMRSYPRLFGPKERLRPIGGEPPDLVEPAGGCRFWPRCELSDHTCMKSTPLWTEIEEGHFLRCHKAPDTLDAHGKERLASSDP